MSERTKLILHRAMLESARKKYYEDGTLWEPLPAWAETKCFTTSKLFKDFDLSRLQTLINKRPASEITSNKVVASAPVPDELENAQGSTQPDLSPQIALNRIHENNPSADASPDDDLEDPKWNALLADLERDQCSTQSDLWPPMALKPICEKSSSAHASPDDDLEPKLNSFPCDSERVQCSTQLEHSPGMSLKPICEKCPSPDTSADLKDPKSNYSSIAREYGIDSVDSFNDPEYEPDNDDFSSEEEEEEEEGEKENQQNKHSQKRSHPKIKENVSTKRPCFGLVDINQNTPDGGLVPYDFSCSSDLDEMNEDEFPIQHDDSGGLKKDGTPKKSKKTEPRPDRWKSNVAKRKRNCGKSYVTGKKGKEKIRKARVMKEPCSDRCRLECTKKFSEAERKAIFEKFWGIGNIDKQRWFLTSCMKTVGIAREEEEGDQVARRRRKNTDYQLKHASKPEWVRVCKVFFLATLDVTSKMIRTVLAKQDNEGTVAPDLRGKSLSSRRDIPEQLKEGVIAHINSIPRIESHYLRAQTTKEFIDGGKTVADLYRDYREICKKSNEPFVKYSMYCNIFNTSFNISFFQPKKDLCEDCEAHKNKTEEEKEADIGYFKHLEEKNWSREEKDRDKNAPEDVVVCTYDLQTVLPLPKGEISVFYYLSKVATYNFTICDIKSLQSTCYLWHEGEANRGANEIASCVWKYLQHKSQQTPDEFEVIFYSDNCTGQNKNKFIIGLYAHALKELPNLRSVTHKYLIKGHTQNEGDSVHSVIERQVKRALKSGPIYIPMQYSQIIRDARKKTPPFTVIDLCHQDFHDFKDLTTSVGTNFTVNTDGEKIHFNDIKILRLSKNQTDRFDYKLSYRDEAFKTIILKPRAKRSSSGKASSPIILKPSYTKPCGVAPKKKAELLKLFEKKNYPASLCPFL